MAGPQILDKLPFKFYFTVIAISSTALSYSLPIVGKSYFMFAVYIFISNFLFGLIQAGFPIYYAQTFGPELGSQLYPYFFTASSFANFIIALIVFELQKRFLGHLGMLYLTATASVLAFFTLLFMNSEVFGETSEPLLTSESNYKTTNTGHPHHDKSIYDRGRLDFTLLECQPNYSFVTLNLKNTLNKRETAMSLRNSVMHTGAYSRFHHNNLTNYERMHTDGSE